MTRHAPRFDLVINDGLVFDGTGQAPRLQSLGISQGVVVELADRAYPPEDAVEVHDAKGRWVMPGFIDCHTHYDAEIEGAPALTESLRHGVTTVLVGGCSLGAVFSPPSDVADLFTRVEGIPRAHVERTMEEKKTWDSPATYRAHFDHVALGPNVAAFVGHSDLRAHVMGLDRATTADERATPAELAKMESLLEDALGAGFLGASINANTWDKVGGSRYGARLLPSAFAPWSEVRRLTAVLRKEGRILQGIPNISTKVNALLFLLESTGVGRRALKTNVVSMVDVRSNRRIARLLGYMSRFVNRVLRADFRWQALPVPFDIFADGVDVPVFEELGAGSAALDVAEDAARRELFRDAAYRRYFRRQWTSILLPRVFHRDFNQSKIEAAPDASLVGKSIAAVAAERQTDVVDTFLDLIAEHGEALRWSTVIGNDRPGELARILNHPDILVGFSDAGAHLRNMAFYNMNLRMLRMARDAAASGAPFMSIERAVHRCTGELAEWFGLDAGVIGVGRRADVVVVDPAGLDHALDEVHEAPIPEFGGYSRMVRRNDRAVPLVVVGGRVAFRDGAASDELGREPLGRFLGFGEIQREPLPRAARTAASASPVAAASPSPVAAAAVAGLGAPRGDGHVPCPPARAEPARASA